MKKTKYERDGISFEYPEEWQADEQIEGESWSVHLQSPGTAFCIISLQVDADDHAYLADVTFNAFKEEYPELDAEDKVEKISGHVAIGHDIDLIALDTTVFCQTRCLQTDLGPVLIMTQCGEPEYEKYKDILKEIVSHIHINED